MSHKHWVAATIISSLTIMTYVTGFVYTRSEGEALSARVDRMQKRTEKNQREIRKELIDLNKWLRSN